jgi:hypothetical protein
MSPKGPHQSHPRARISVTQGPATVSLEGPQQAQCSNIAARQHDNQVRTALYTPVCGLYAFTTAPVATSCSRTSQSPAQLANSG